MDMSKKAFVANADAYIERLKARVEAARRELEQIERLTGPDTKADDPTLEIYQRRADHLGKCIQDVYAAQAMKEEMLRTWDEQR